MTALDILQTGATLLVLVLVVLIAFIYSLLSRRLTALACDSTRVNSFLQRVFEYPLKWCTKVVYGNWSYNHCNQSDAWLSTTSRAVLANAQLPFPPVLLEHARMHAYTYVHTHTFTLAHNMHSLTVLHFKTFFAFFFRTVQTKSQPACLTNC